MKKFILLSALCLIIGAQIAHGSETPPAKGWKLFTLFSEPFRAKHSIEFTEGPKSDSNWDSSVFCGKITQEHPHGQVTRDNTTTAESATPKITKPLCDPATCFHSCVCKDTEQPVSLLDLLRSLKTAKKEPKKSVSSCTGLCVLDETCQCGTLAGRYNKSHPHVRLGSPRFEKDGTIAQDMSVDLKACTIDKDISTWVHVICDRDQKVYEAFRIKQITTGGSDVTKQLEDKYRLRKFR